ncbi:hypothetical protein HHK36_016100 [Tetracentron sinense]|uniref:PRA1 family protein n=1 Tax=Tetracentron sinense TaxID=13715 RepID=A0A834Z2X3_TETSI|nr:hypothetical protein HHK36_016100 [Tetracentron sinense]
MASPSPPILPISNPQTTAVSTDQSQPPIATPAFRAFVARISDTFRHGIAQRRPWSELVDRSSFSRPDSLSDALSRTLAGLSVLTVVVVFLTSVGSLLMSALMLGLAIVSAHGAFRVPEDLFLDDQEGASSTGFLSFLGGAASNVAATPPVAARV